MSLTQFDAVVDRRLHALRRRLTGLREAAVPADPSELALVELMIDDLVRVRREHALRVT